MRISTMEKKLGILNNRHFWCLPDAFETHTTRIPDDRQTGYR